MPVPIPWSQVRSNEDLRRNYATLYQVPTYRTGAERLEILRRLPWRDFLGSYSGDGPATFVDVGCGRGEALDLAEAEGFEVLGFEIVPELCDEERVRLIETAASLPLTWCSIDVVGCFDVLEHVLPDETEAVLGELVRIASEVWLNIATGPGFMGDRKDLGDPHINVRPAEAWIELLEAEGAEVEELERSDRCVTLRAWNG